MRTLLLIVIGFFYSCATQKEYTFDEFKRLNPTHKVIDSIILKPIEELFYKKKLFTIYPKKEFIVLRVIKDSPFKNIFRLTINDFEFEKEYSKDIINSNDILIKELRKLKGYFFYRGVPILIYGDIDSFFDRTNSKVKNIFYSKKQFHGIFPIYEPSVYEYELLNGNLKFKGEL